MRNVSLVDLLDGGSRGTTGSGGGTAWHATGHTTHSTGHTTALTIELGDDGSADPLELLLLVFILVLLSALVGIQPGDDLTALVRDGLAVVSGDLVLDLIVLDGGLHVEGIALKGVLSGDSVSLFVVLSTVLLCIVDHALNVLLGETALVVGDGNFVLLAGALVSSTDVQDTVGVDVEGDLDLWNTTGCWGDARELKLAKEVVVAGHGTLTLVDLDEDTGLVVSIGGEGLGLLGGNSCVPLNKGSHDTTGSLNTERQWGDVKEKKVLDSLALVTGKDSGLNGSTIGDSLVRVDALVQLLAVEEVLKKLLDLGDTGGSTNKNKLMDLGFVHLGITERLLDWVQGATEEISAKLNVRKQKKQTDSEWSPSLKAYVGPTQRCLKSPSISNKLKIQEEYRKQ